MAWPPSCTHLCVSSSLPIDVTDVVARPAVTAHSPTQQLIQENVPLQCDVQHCINCYLLPQDFQLWQSPWETIQNHPLSASHSLLDQLKHHLVGNESSRAHCLGDQLHAELRLRVWIIDRIPDEVSRGNVIEPKVFCYHLGVSALPNSRSTEQQQEFTTRGSTAEIVRQSSHGSIINICQWRYCSLPLVVSINCSDYNLNVGRLVAASSGRLRGQPQSSAVHQQVQPRQEGRRGLHQAQRAPHGGRDQAEGGDQAAGGEGGEAEHQDREQQAQGDLRGFQEGLLQQWSGQEGGEEDNGGESGQEEEPAVDKVGAGGDEDERLPGQHQEGVDDRQLPQQRGQQQQDPEAVHQPRVHEGHSIVPDQPPGGDGEVRPEQGVHGGLPGVLRADGQPVPVPGCPVKEGQVIPPPVCMVDLTMQSIGWADQQCCSKLRHLISEWMRQHLSWQMRSPQRTQLERERFPQIEQYLREGQRGFPTFMFTKLGSSLSYSPSSWMILRRLRLRLRLLSCLARLFMRFSFLRLRGSPSPPSQASSSSSSAILLGSSKKSSSRQRSFSSTTARRLFSSTFRTVAAKRLLRPPWRVRGTALDIQLTMYNCRASKLMIHRVLLFLLGVTALVAGKMVVQSPPALRDYFSQRYNGGDIPFSIANYGAVPYGKTISGELGIPSFLQDCIYEQLPQASRKKILLVQRNDCTFTQKSINVQKEGGKLAVVMDNNRTQNPNQIVMADDGKGAQVTIPTILIRERDGEEMLKYIEEGVVLSVTFETIVREKADLQIWVDILNHNNFIFLRNFQSYYQRIKDHVDLSIGYSTSRCDKKECNLDNCFYETKYCRLPIHYWGVEEGGKRVIEEQLRQYFVFQEHRELWWNYMLEFDDNCDDLAIFHECSKKVMKYLGIDYGRITALTGQSFGEKDNEVLKNMSDYKYAHSLIYYPSIVANNVVYRGNLEPYQVYDLICESLTPMPEGCEDSSFASTDDSHVFLWIVFGVASSFLFIIFLVCCFRRMARRQLTASMNRQVNELVNQYITMYENDKFKEGTELPQRQ